MNYLKEITGKKDTSEFDVVSFPLVQKKKYFGTLEKTRQMCRLFISQGGAFWGAHWWCIFRCPVTFQQCFISCCRFRQFRTGLRHDMKLICVDQPSGGVVKIKFGHIGVAGFYCAFDSQHFFLVELEAVSQITYGTVGCQCK